MKIAIVGKDTPKDTPKHTDVIDLSQACSVRCQDEPTGSQSLTVKYAGGLCFYFDTGHYDFFRVVQEPSKGSIAVSREPTTPGRIVTYYEAS